MPFDVFERCRYLGDMPKSREPIYSFDDRLEARIDETEARAMQPILAAAGKTLYGERFQRALARDLDRAPRTIQNWLEGRGTPRKDDPVWEDLRKLLHGKLRELSQVVSSLDEARDPDRTDQERAFTRSLMRFAGDPNS